MPVLSTKEGGEKTICAAKCCHSEIQLESASRNTSPGSDHGKNLTVVSSVFIYEIKKPALVGEQDDPENEFFTVKLY